MTALEGPDYQLQVQVVAVLRASDDLQALIGADGKLRLYEVVPKDAPFPYCTIGQSQDLPDLADCIDGSEINFPITIWSNSTSFKEAKQIAKCIRDTLTAATITMTQNRCLLIQRDQAGDFSLVEPDGVTRRVIANFRALLEPL